MTHPATPLPTRTLGALNVSAIGLGCMNISHAYDVPPAEEDAIRLLNHALDAGVTLLDSAALYGSGSNERLLAKAVGHRRGDYILSSKCVLDLIDGNRVLDARPEVIAGSLERSLKRLETDFIDLYYMHRLDPQVPIEDSMGALVRAKEAGKIGAIGLSEMSAPQIRRAHAVHPITAVQSEYSPWVRNPEVAVLETCKELGIGFVAFSPLARGFLADGVTNAKFTAGDIRISMPRFQEPNFSRNLELARRFNEVAAQAGLTPAQLSLGWVMARWDHIVPIPGTRSIAHLDEDLGAAGLTLGQDLVDAVDAIFAPGAVRGARYSAAAQSQIDTELLPNEELA